MADDLNEDWWVSETNSVKANSEKRKKSHKNKDNKCKASEKKVQCFTDNSILEPKQKKRKREKTEVKDITKSTDIASQIHDEDVTLVKGKKKKLKNKTENGAKSAAENEVGDEDGSVVKGKKKKLKNKAENVVESTTEKEVDYKTSDNPVHHNSAAATNKIKKTKTKHKRKKITEWLASQVAKPLEPSDLISAIAKHHEGKLSAVETDEIRLAEDHFALCNDLCHTPVSFLKTLFPKWKKSVERMKSLPRRPLLLVICASGLRSVEFIRAISEFKVGDCKIAKLFAKHMKIEEQQKFLQNNTIHIGVGTPNRLQVLLDNGDLSLDQVKYIVLDWSWRDAKKRQMMNIEQVRNDVIYLLTKTIIPHVKQGSSKLALL